MVVGFFGLIRQVMQHPLRFIRIDGIGFQYAQSLKFCGFGFFG